MWSGFLMLAIGWLIPLAGGWCGAICSGSLDALEWLVEWAESLPGGHFWAPGPAWWWVVVFYLGLLAAMICGRALCAAALASCAALCVDSRRPRAAAGSRVDARRLGMLVRRRGPRHVRRVANADGETLLYDAGSLGSPEYATQADRLLSLAPRHHADRRTRDLARRHRSLQRRAGAAGAVSHRHGVRVAHDVRRLRRTGHQRRAGGAARGDRARRRADSRNLVRRPAASWAAT